jgi:uncharacterized membrane protein YfcA
MLGTRLLTRLPGAVIRRIFILVLVVVCGEMLGRGVQGFPKVVERR